MNREGSGCMMRVRFIFTIVVVVFERVSPFDFAARVRSGRTLLFDYVHDRSTCRALHTKDNLARMACLVPWNVKQSNLRGTVMRS